MRETGRQVTNSFALGNMAELVNELAEASSKLNENMNQTVLKTFKDFIGAFTKLDGTKLNKPAEAMESALASMSAALEKIKRLSTTPTGALSSTLTDLLSTTVSSVKSYINTINGINVEGFKEKIDAVPQALAESSKEVQKHAQKIGEVMEDVEAKFDITENPFSKTMNGLRDAINNFNTALTGAKFDEATGA